jgi:DNA-directed RNA polymerase subunit RPC12/RpoP
MDNTFFLIIFFFFLVRFLFLEFFLKKIPSSLFIFFYIFFFLLLPLMFFLFLSSSLWMHILHSYVSIAQATKKWLNISCFFHCGCIFCTRMWVLHKPPKNDSTFHVYVGIDNMPKKPTSFLWAQCKYCNIEQKTNAYYWITCWDCKLNLENPMHILWLSCKYCNSNHIVHVVSSYIWYCTKVLVFIEILCDALKYCNIPQTRK